jgi:hypothetical protein
MKKLIRPNSTQGWVELHQYDLGFYWLNLLIYKTHIKENWKKMFCMGIYNFKKGRSTNTFDYTWNIYIDYFHLQIYSHMKNLKSHVLIYRYNVLKEFGQKCF